MCMSCDCIDGYCDENLRRKGCFSYHFEDIVHHVREDVWVRTALDCGGRCTRQFWYEFIVGIQRDDCWCSAHFLLYFLLSLGSHSEWVFSVKPLWKHSRHTLRVLFPRRFQIQFSWQGRSTTFCPPYCLVTRLQLGMGSGVCVLWSSRARSHEHKQPWIL